MFDRGSIVHADDRGAIRGFVKITHAASLRRQRRRAGGEIVRHGFDLLPRGGIVKSKPQRRKRR
jgi:hypothetical protein